MKTSVHSRYSKMLREAQSACAEARVSGIPIDEVTAMRHERARVSGVNRREWLRQAMGAAGAAALAGLGARRAAASTQPRIAIIGGGAAGLECAHALWSGRGYQSTVYEWNSYPGGRIQTIRGFFSNGQIAEQHGEFISSEHTLMLQLVKQFGLTLDFAEGYPPGTANTYWFNGGVYTQAQLNADWQAYGYALFRNSAAQAPWPTQYNHYTAQAYAWDQMSVADWIGENLPGGANTAFGKLCYQDVISEYGGAPEQQSALNLIYLLAFDDSSPSSGQPKIAPVLAGTDERYHIHGGNDQLITSLVTSLPAGTVQTGYQLVALAQNSDQSYTCTFQSGGSMVEVVADHVVLAIPFTTLRNVDLSQANLSALKMEAIQNLQLGTNAKMQLQFASRLWYNQGANGTSYSDAGAEVTWECTNYQPGPTGILVDYTGGTEGADMGALYGLTTPNNPAPPAMSAATLGYLEPIYPGITAAFNGLGYYSIGLLDPHIGGAYSYYQVGQYTGFSGIEGQQEGNIHFAGEQTSVNFQGFMEGSVRSGLKAAGEI